MSLWDLLVSICFFIAPVGAVDSAKHAGSSFEAYGIAIVTGVGIGALCALGMWSAGRTAGTRILKLDSESLRQWSYRALYGSSIFWIFLSAVLGRSTSSSLLRLVA